MATIALPRPVLSHNATPDIDGRITPPSSLEGGHHSSKSQHCPRPVPNKHIPLCPTGPAKDSRARTPPASPTHTDECTQQQSLLFPPHDFLSVEINNLRVYELHASQVMAALDFVSCQPLPTTDSMFPWLHGLHPKNQLQQSFFTDRRKSRDPPTCSRGILLVKANGDLSRARLKGAVSPDEFLATDSDPRFIEADPREGFSIRNFQIQTAKTALISDVVVYGEDAKESEEIAWKIAAAQIHQRQQQAAHSAPVVEYNTFLCLSAFSEFEEGDNHLVAIDSEGYSTGQIVDFVQQERSEMWEMTRASEIAHNVYMGPSPESGSTEENDFDVLIECSDLGQLNPVALQNLAEGIDDLATRSYFDFPSSGSLLPPTWSNDEADGIVETCKWIYHLAHGTLPTAHDVGGHKTGPPDRNTGRNTHRRVLIHCADGYTESTLLGIAYYSYSTGQSVPHAWLDLHMSKRRNFFAYPADVSLLKAIGPRLLRESPACAERNASQITKQLKDEPKWLPALDGSFPSRILDYLYLGNLIHANNPDLLKELGIGQILSVGETASWREGELEAWGPDNVYVVQDVQDNGIDSLTDEFPGCLEFIDRGREKGISTLVHCRVGVSRSATICIAQVMNALHISFPRAYCFVRARRLNVIIQPHLRFAYELLHWEECLQQRGDGNAPLKREMEWNEIAREVALINRPYARC